MEHTYWGKTEIAKQFAKVNSELYELQRRPEFKDNERWRELYKIRCDLGRIEHNAYIRLGFKDGVKYGSDVQEVQERIQE